MYLHVEVDLLKHVFKDTLGVGSTYEDIQILKRLLFFKVLYHRKG